jgi:16S rRNA (cytidine1402-2'-O)-methyltransferase
VSTDHSAPEHQGRAALPPGPGLHLVSTPIGAARDITLRALDTLRLAEVLAAEDTRALRHLMDIHGIPLGGRPLVSWHDHSGDGATARLLAALREGRSVAYASEAGTPLISDPGFDLVRAAVAAGLPVTAAPGPTAAICALTLSGLPTDRFHFAGFPPTAPAARLRFLAGLRPIRATLVLYESPKRVRETLDALVQALGAEREAALCRELTKRFEEVIRGRLGDLAQQMAQREAKGEIVLVIDRGAEAEADLVEVRAALVQALRELRVKEAAAMVAEGFGLPRKDVYRMALEIGRGEGGADGDL